MPKSRARRDGRKTPLLPLVSLGPSAAVTGRKKDNLLTRSGYVEKARHLVLVLGDQLDRESAAFDGFDKDADAVLMLEVREEAS